MTTSQQVVTIGNMGALVALLVGSLFYVVNSVVIAKTLGTLWAWFLAAEYGGGPSTGAWFGLAAMVSFVLSLSKINEKRETKLELDSARNILIFEIGFLVGIGLLLAFIRLTGAITGWAS